MDIENLFEEAGPGRWKCKECNAVMPASVGGEASDLMERHAEGHALLERAAAAPTH